MGGEKENGAGLPRADGPGEADRGGPRHGSAPWTTAARRLKRLELAQLAVLIGIAVVTVVGIVAFARASSSALDDRDAARDVQLDLYAARDRLRLRYTEYLTQRIRGERSAPALVAVALRVAEADVREIASRREGAPTPAARAAAAGVTEGIGELREIVAPLTRSVPPLGSPADLRNLDRTIAIVGDLEGDASLWLSEAGARVATADRRVADVTRALSVALPTAVVVLTALGLALWRLFDRARRRVTNAMGGLVAEQSALREVATRVAAEEDPDAIFRLVAKVAGESAGAEGAVITHFLDGHGTRVGAWTDPRAGVADPPPSIDLAGPSATAHVFRTGRPATVCYDEHVSDADSSRLLSGGYRSAVAVPVRIGGQLWGAIAVACVAPQPPPGAEERLMGLADLVVLALESAEARSRLARQAATDPLTGLANHRTFQERLRSESTAALRTGGALSLVVFDLDHFKEVNDTFGHQIGDDVLRDAAERIAAQAREPEVVARIGGEEFAWLLPGADAVDAWQAAERVRLAIGGEAFDVAGRVTVSAGVCDLDAAGGNPAELTRLADGALYWAKAQGRNAAFRYTPGTMDELSASERAERLARTQALTALQALARAVDARDTSTRRHSERVAELAARLATELGWPEPRADALRQAGLMHDVGKLGVPDAVLLKTEPLTAEEFALVRQHAARGAEILTGVLSPEQVAWVRGHHERWDGGGYPDGLAGDAIPDGARLLAIADAWDVMTGVRLYTRPRSPDDAIEECRAHRGLQFAPDAVDALAALAARGGLDDILAGARAPALP